MIVHHQMTVFKLPQVPLRPTTMNHSPYQTEALKGPEIQNVKIIKELKHTVQQYMNASFKIKSSKKVQPK